MSSATSWQRMFSVARKELLHILRDPQTLFMTLFFPIVELMMLGYAIDTNVRNIPTVIFDQDDTQQSRELVRKFKLSTVVKEVARVDSEQAMVQAIVDGKARVGIKVPYGYGRRLEEARAGRLMEGEP